MTIHKLAKNLEIKFWDALIPIMEEKGPIMKIKQFLYGIIHSKPGYLALLILIWGAVGFVAGMLIGRIIGIIPLP